MTPHDIVARRFFVSGRVQGVGYRIFVQEVADRLGLRGFVRNRRDGRVEVFAAGTLGQLRELRAELNQGPFMSRVVDVLEEPATLDTRYGDSFSVEMTI